MKRRLNILLICLGIVICAGTFFTVTIAELIGETLVNSGDTTGDQNDPSVAMDPNGNSVIKWYSQDGDGNGSGIYAKMYDITGASVFFIKTYDCCYLNS